MLCVIAQVCVCLHAVDFSVLRDSVCACVRHNRHMIG